MKRGFGGFGCGAEAACDDDLGVHSVEHIEPQFLVGEICGDCVGGSQFENFLQT